MKYNDLSVNLGFQKNMQETNWLKLFPKWWSENDPLLQTIGQEIAYLKAQAILNLLNVTIKPPVMIWQNSICHKEYIVEDNIKTIPETIALPATLYKTFGTITLNNNTSDDITNLKIGFTDTDYIIIHDIIEKGNTINIDVGSQNVKINKKQATISKYGDGVSYFKTCQYNYDFNPIVEKNIVNNSIVLKFYKTYELQDNQAIIDQKIYYVEENKIIVDGHSYNINENGTYIDSLFYYVDIINNKITVKGVPNDFDGKIQISINNGEKSTEVYNGEYQDEIDLGSYKYPKQPILISFYNSEIYDNVVINEESKVLQRIRPKDVPLHNEAIKLSLDCLNNINSVDIDVKITLNNAVFINEQNIEVNGLELIPLEKIELYAKYDFPYNPESNGWRQVYNKKYDVDTNVVYDMITTHFYTKQFYVEVYYKGLDYPYKVGFPCYKDAKKSSIYHINEKLDEWGKYLGLERRNYKTNIPDEDLPFTFPQFYPFDIEQDYWYYSRLVNEYAWNPQAINDVDILDTNGDPVLRLHSIDPFIQDFVVYAKSTYPTERENIDYDIFVPNYVNQKDNEASYKRVPYFETQNLLRYDNNKAHITLLNKAGTYISSQSYISKTLELFFNLENLPEDINIDNITIIVEAEATDNNIDKYSNNETGIIIPSISSTTVFPMRQSTNYQMEDTEIIYNLKDTLEDIKKEYANYIDNNIIHRATIQPFAVQQRSYIKIPFKLTENDENVDDITEVYVTYDGYGTYKGEYIVDGTKKYIRVYIPEIISSNDIIDKELRNPDQLINVSIACKSANHNPAVINDIKLQCRIVDDEKDYIDLYENVQNNDYEVSDDIKHLWIYGPYHDDKLTTEYFEDVWHTGDIRNGLQKDGIYFVNVFENDNDKNTPAIFLKNIRLRIDYSEKKNVFDLHTQITHNGVVEPAIAKLNVDIENTGSKNLKTQIDIVHATNIKLSQTYFDVDLIPNQSNHYSIDIIPEYPIYDGEYDILTICEDKVCENSVIVSANGLIKTGVLLENCFGQYNKEFTIKASVTNISNLNINDSVSKMLFFIDGFKIGESIIVNNNASIVVLPSNNKYLQPGLHTVEARFSGNHKFASSRIQKSLLISKNNTYINLNASNVAVYDKEYNIVVTIYTTDESGSSIPINEGSVSFYLDEDIIGVAECQNGMVTWSTSNLTYEPKEYVLTAKYNGTETYAQNSVTQSFNIIGGETSINVFDIDAKPDDIITLKAKVTNAQNKPLSQGYIKFTIFNDTETIFVSQNINIERGFGSIDYHIDANILQYESLNTIRTYDIVVDYIDTENIYQNSQGIGNLSIERGTVTITGANVFFGSQYEPLGFYFKVTDAKTNEPINDGSVSISIPLLNIVCPSVNLDNDGGVRVIYNPINFTADEFAQLLKFHLGTGNLMPYTDSEGNLANIGDDGETIISWNKSDLYRVYDGELSDLNLMDFSIEYDDDNNGFLKYELKDENSNSIGEENIFIDENGYLYARTNIDFNRIYKYLGEFDVNIQYTSSNKYKNQSKQAIIQLNQPAIDIDIHSQNITYNDTTKSIICYVTQYNLTTDPTTEVVNDGKVYFFIDGDRVGESNVNNGMALLKSDELIDIKYGHHMLMAEYISDVKPITYTYADIVINPIVSTVNAALNRQFKGEKSKLSVSVSISDIYDVAITGNIDVYLDDSLIGSTYLFGFEDLPGNVSYDVTSAEHHLSTINIDFVVDMPEDIDIAKHVLTIKYSGDDHILPSESVINLIETQLPVIFDTKTVYVAKGNNCHLHFDLTSIDDGYINDGEIALYKGQDNLMTKGYVKNNIATLDWIMKENPSSEPYLYHVKYINGTKYKNSEEIVQQYIYVIEPKEDVYIAQNSYHIPNDYDIPFDISLMEASQCVKNNGNIHILDDVKITEDTFLYQNINIIGNSDVKIIKDLPNLLTEENSTIQIYSFNNFNEDIFEIIGLTKDYLNNKDFHIIDNDIYFVQDNTLVPIFLLTDDKFYAYKQLSLSSVVSNISLNLYGEININNIHFTSTDSTNVNDFIIYAKNKINIQKSIIDKEVTIYNQNDLQINTSFIYGNIVGSDNYNLDNNWWGSNDKPDYNINNHIILQLSSNIDPPIIGDDIGIQIQMIGNNTVPYDLPPATFYFEAETGYFSIPTGKTIDGVAQTTYFDGTSECTIYCTIDNETVSLDILDYNRKTEVILEEAIDIPIGYQIPIRAKVQSVADIYYKFNNNNQIVEKSNNINNGYVKFYVNNKQIGRAIVVDGEAELPVYFSELQYPIIEDGIIQYTCDIYAEYIPDEYYFKSSNQKLINLIDGSKVCFVTSEININGDGSFNNPYDSIGKGVRSNKEIVYLKPGIYNDNNITIVGTQNIKRYNGECIFKNNTEPIFNSTSPTTLNLTGLTFNNNETSYLIDNIDIVNIDECIFLDNSCTKLINDNTVARIQYSVFVNNIGQIQNYKNGYELQYCWFGTNTPNEDLNEPNNITIDRYVVMDFISSKEILYLGSVAHLTAKLKNYYYNGNTYPLQKSLPLRVAKFETTYGSLMPIMDYTYDNKVITFLDTNNVSTNDKIILKTPNNNNYINKPITLECYVTNLYNENIDVGKVKFNIIEKELSLTTDIHNGVAVANFDIPLDKGEYTLECIYENCKIVTTFTVDIPHMLVQSFNLEPNDYVYDLVFGMSVIDVFDNTNINQNVNIFIDDIFITEEIINNGTLMAHLYYDNINIGTHTLKITTEDLNSEYKIFEYEKQFIVTKKNTYISFNYNGLAADVPTDLIIYVYDDNNRLVNDGNISLLYDNEIVYVDDDSQYVREETNNINIELQNGLGIIYGFYSEKDQHSIVIQYHANDTVYNNCIYTNNNFNVGLEEVIIESEELINQLSVDIGKNFTLQFPIKDKYNNMVKRGQVSLYLDYNQQPLNSEPLIVDNGYVYFEGSLPLETKAIVHDFMITYMDPSKKYLPTTYYGTINVHPIATQIIIPTIYTGSNTIAKIKYDIESEYGLVRTGKLEAFFNNQSIGWADVSDIDTYINLTIPILSDENQYIIHFKYSDDSKSYSTMEQDVNMVIVKPKVKIVPQISEYYPQKHFNYIVNVTDQNNINIDVGTITLYIDNVLTDTQSIHNGQATIPLMLDAVRDYNFNIVYNENNYYDNTEYPDIFKVNNISIYNIGLEQTYSVPNTTIETTLIIDTPDNINVTDGFVDFYLNNNKIDTYAIVEDTKYVKLHIPNLDAGIYPMKIAYYNSEFFKDDDFDFDFEIKKQNITLTTPQSIITPLNSIIDFNINIQENIIGNLEYYLIATENDIQATPRFIGIESINNQNTVNFKYKLPNNLEYHEGTIYKILVKFTGNGQYNTYETSLNLIIEKETPQIIDFTYTDEVEYESYLSTHFKTIPNTIVYFYLDNNKIGYIDTNNIDDDGYLTFRYNLNDTYIPNTKHTLKVQIKESATLNALNKTYEVRITKSTPILTTSSMEAYVGQKIKLPTNVVNNKGFDIELGTLKYKINNVVIGECSPGEELLYQLDKTYMEEKEITVIYTNDSEFYNNFTDTVIIELQKNTLYFNINNRGPVTRGTSITENITLSSATTQDFSDVVYNVYLEDDIINTLPTINISTDLPDKDVYILRIEFNGNDMFNPTHRTFELVNKNSKLINLNDVSDLNAAISLIADYGTINIDKNIKNITVTNNKNINIVGNEHVMTNMKIINNGNLTISDLTFKDSDDSVITNNNILKIKDCIFSNNNAQNGAAIYITNKNVSTEIINCVFNANTATVYGGAIYSDRGNDVTIKACQFKNNNRADYHGSSIASSGNMYISHNVFYNNNSEHGDCEIFVINNTMEIEHNFFDGKIKSIYNNGGNVIANLNYYGCNDIEKIKNNNINIDIDTWLLSDYTIRLTEPQQNYINRYVTPIINKYKNILEKEENIYDNKIQNIPVLINEEEKTLGIEYSLGNNNATLQIGKVIYQIGD